MGKDTMWNEPAVRLAAVGARRLPGHPRHRRPRGAAALHRGARGGRAARAVPGGRAQVRADRAAAVRRCRLRRRQGRRADRPVGIGGSERVMPKGAKFIYPRKVHVVIGPPIPAADRRRRARCRARRSSEHDRPSSTPSCSGCSTSPSDASARSGDVGRRRSRRASADASHGRVVRRRTARGPSASTAAARRRRRWRCRGGSR